MLPTVMEWAARRIERPAMTYRRALTVVLLKAFAREIRGHGVRYALQQGERLVRISAEVTRSYFERARS